MQFNCLMAAEPLWGGSLLFDTKFPEIPGTHFINFGKMKGWVNLGAIQWSWTQDPWIGNPAIVRKGSPAPLFKAPTPWPSLPLFKIFVCPPLFSVPSPFKAFYTVPTTLMQPPPALIQPTNLPWFKQIQKGNFTSSTVTFYQESIFNFLNPFTNRLS